MSGRKIRKALGNEYYDVYTEGIKIKAQIQSAEERVNQLRQNVQKLKYADTNDLAAEIQKKCQLIRGDLNQIRSDLNEFQSHSSQETQIVVNTTYTNYSQRLAKLTTDLMALITQTHQIVEMEDVVDGSNLLQFNYMDGSNLLQVQSLIDGQSGADLGYIYARETNNELVELEKSVIELHQIFIDMAAQVECQAELITMSEIKIQDAVSQTAHALQSVTLGEKHMNRARKKFAIGLLITLATIIIIVGIVGAAITCLLMLGA